MKWPENFPNNPAYPMSARTVKQIFRILEIKSHTVRFSLDSVQNVTDKDRIC